MTTPCEYTLAEVDRLRAVCLQTYCAYCGEFFPADGDGRSTDAVTEHIRTCDKHPMREPEAEVERLKEQLRYYADRAVHETGYTSANGGGDE